MGYLGSDTIDPVFACFDFDLLRETIARLGLASEDASSEELLRLYFEHTEVSEVSPNAWFDETWYRRVNEDVTEAIGKGVFQSAFMHFVRHGIYESRWPSPKLASLACNPDAVPDRQEDFDQETYLALNESARSFLRHFPMLSPIAHYNGYGRWLGMLLPVAAPAAESTVAIYFDVMAAEFDAKFYTERYLQGTSRRRFGSDPFTHYLVHGIPAGNSPSDTFDEGWYRAFYPEIRVAIENGKIPCGFYHYVVAGRLEGRLPRYERKQALEARIPGVTRPALLERIPEIRTRMLSRQIKVVENATPRIWVLLPTMNPDITFGGYRSVFELMRKLHEFGWPITIVCTEDGQADKSYFLWRESSETFRNLIREIDVIGHVEGQSLEVGPHDTVLAYSLWDLYAADHIRQVAPGTRVVLLAQEFEPIFYDNCSARALAEEAYRIPHYPLINSNFLRRFFENHRIGVFGAHDAPVPGRDFSVFEHRINRLASQTADEMRARSQRVLVAYARPEGHAARNMFEILVLALQTVCEEGLFGPEWEFIGLGALTDLQAVPLGGGHFLTIHPKMSEEEYTRYIRTLDIGISLMFAPHPSVMPFEFATTGALVVTNAYENRSVEELAAISANIIAGRPSIEGIAEALREAARRVTDADERVRNIFQPAKSSWDGIFDSAFVEEAFGAPGAIPAKLEPQPLPPELVPPEPQTGAAAVAQERKKGTPRKAKDEPPSPKQASSARTKRFG